MQGIHSDKVSMKWAPPGWEGIPKPPYSTETIRYGMPKNVFVTDGACMTSAAAQNPSLTYMALTARAADFAVSELKKGNI
jgi:hypothetical protein